MRIKFFEFIHRNVDSLKKTLTSKMLTPWKRLWPPKFRPRGSSWPSTHKKLKNTAMYTYEIIGKVLARYLYTIYCWPFITYLYCGRTPYIQMITTNKLSSPMFIFVMLNDHCKCVTFGQVLGFSSALLAVDYIPSKFSILLKVTTSALW